MSALPLAGCTYGWLHQTSLETALEELAEGGYRSVELTTASPHFSSAFATAVDRLWLRRTLQNLDIEVVSINPGFLDINLVSPSQLMREASRTHMRAEIELAADLEAPFVVVMPGKRHALAPLPDDSARALAEDSVGDLADRAAELGVSLGIENGPYGFMGPVGEILDLVTAVNRPNVGVTYDVANTPRGEDPIEGLRAVADRLFIAHVSDTWVDKWAHTSIGRGEVDFGAFAEGLREIGFTGPTAYELVDLEPVTPRMDADLTALRGWGWDQTIRAPRRGDTR